MIKDIEFSESSYRTVLNFLNQIPFWIEGVIYLASLSSRQEETNHHRPLITANEDFN